MAKTKLFLEVTSILFTALKTNNRENPCPESPLEVGDFFLA